MFLVYVDESGDIGLNNSPSGYFCLSAIIIHESDWHFALDKVIEFRQYLKIRYGLKLREEIHSSHFIHKPKDLQRIPKSLRIRLLRDVLDFQATLENYTVINVVINKKNKDKNSDIFNLAWQTLIQKTNEYVDIKNHSENKQETALLFVDKTDEVKLRQLTRNLIRTDLIRDTVGQNFGYRQKPTKILIEDAVHRNSAHSYFIQLADVNAYFLGQKFEPCQYIKRQGGRNYFKRLSNISYGARIMSIL